MSFFSPAASLGAEDLFASPRSTPPLQADPKPLSKPHILERLKTFRNKELQSLEAIDQLISKAVLESRDVSLKAPDSIAQDRFLHGILEQLRNLQGRRDETLLRRDFFNQLIFQVDSQWNPSQPLAPFLEQRLLEMAQAELTSATSPATSAPRLWQFYIYLSIAVREIPDPREDLLALLSGYVEFSSLREPKSPIAYMDSQHYTNGAVSQTAHPARKQEIGKLVEKRLKELGITDAGKRETSTGTGTATKPRPADIELRTKAPSNPAAKRQKRPN